MHSALENADNKKLQYNVTRERNCWMSIYAALRVPFFLEIYKMHMNYFRHVSLQIKSFGGHIGIVLLGLQYVTSTFFLSVYF